jgi:glycosyltransferase involved in cell wall biosynthesis
MKLPTVGSNAIGVRELVVDGKTGILTELRSVEGIVTALTELIEDPRKRREYGENAYARIAVPFSLENASRAQLRMYDDITR